MLSYDTYFVSFIPEPNDPNDLNDPNDNMSFQNTEKFKRCNQYTQRKPIQQPQMQCKTCTRGLECSGDPTSWGKHSEETIIKRESLLNAEEAAKRALQFAIQSAAEKAQLQKNRAAIANLLSCDPEIVDVLIESKIINYKTIAEFLETGFIRLTNHFQAFPILAARGVISEYISGSGDEPRVNLENLFGSYSIAFNQFPKAIRDLCKNGFLKLPIGTAIISSIATFYERRFYFLQNGIVFHFLIEIFDTGHFHYFRSEYELSRFRDDPINKLGDAFAKMSERKNANGDAECSIM